MQSTQKENGEKKEDKLEVQIHQEEILGHESAEDMEIEADKKGDQIIEEDEGKQEEIGAGEAQEIVLAFMGCHGLMDMEEDLEDFEDLSDHLEDILEELRPFSCGSKCGVSIEVSQCMLFIRCQ